MKLVDETTTRRSRRDRPLRLLIALLLAAIVVSIPTAALAADESELDGTLRTGDDVTVPADETFDGNLYVFAGQIEINGTIDGDVIAAGGQINIDGTVTGDVLIMGGQVTVSGDVEGDTRFIGGELSVPGDVGGDIAMFGGAADITGTVGQDLLFGVGQMTLAGDVAGDVFGGVGDYDRSGTVGGDEDVTVPTPEEEPTVGDRIADGLLRAVSLFIVGAGLLLLLRRPLNRLVDRVRIEPLRCLLYGLLTVVGLVAAAVGLIVVGIVASIVFGLLGLDLLIGAYWFVFVATVLALAALLFVISVFVAPVVVVLAAVDFIVDRDGGLPLRLVALAVGLLIYVALTTLPIIGGLLGFVAFLFTVGAMALQVRTNRQGDSALTAAAVG